MSARGEADGCLTEAAPPLTVRVMESGKLSGRLLKKRLAVSGAAAKWETDAASKDCKCSLIGRSCRGSSVVFALRMSATRSDKDSR
mmetsp:Transcript_42273/g.99256  ORF Transcript_42273/g.99256 Transcript_42273/m.99256 type:complete len:86 (-) Transcript_42273:682-939(-)